MNLLYSQWRSDEVVLLPPGVPLPTPACRYDWPVVARRMIFSLTSCIKAAPVKQCVMAVGFVKILYSSEDRRI